MRLTRHKSNHAWTLLELVITLATVTMLVFIALPKYHGQRAPRCRIKCVNNLKNVGLAFRIYATDNNDRFPADLVLGKRPDWVELPYSAYMHFATLSNELSTPMIVRCPTDARTEATNFALLRNTNLSYFANIDANETSPHMVLAGDRTIRNGRVPHGGFLTINSNSLPSWTAGGHTNKGNIALADGSVQQMWNAAVLFTDQPPQTLALPIEPPRKASQ